MADVSKITQKVDGYKKDIKNINDGNLKDMKQLPQELESKASNIKEVKALQSNVLHADQYKAMVEKWNSDPEVMKEMALNQAKEQAINHFAGREKRNCKPYYQR